MWKTSSNTVDGAMIAEIISHVVAAIQPLITNTVTVAVTADTSKMWESLTENRRLNLEQMGKATNEINFLKANVQVQKFELDKIEQYSHKAKYNEKWYCTNCKNIFPLQNFEDNDSNVSTKV